MSKEVIYLECAFSVRARVCVCVACYRWEVRPFCDKGIEIRPRGGQYSCKNVRKCASKVRGQLEAERSEYLYIVL